jgi:hypothetical protein
MTHDAGADARRARRLVAGLRLVAVVLVAGLAGLPLAILPSPLLAWPAVGGFLAGAAGVAVLSVPLVTASGAIALLAYAAALVVTGAAVDVVVATGVGTALLLLLEVVHLAGRIDGAAVGRDVVAMQVRHWLAALALGAVASLVLVTGGTALALAVAGTSLPVVVAASGLGALLAVAGVLVRMTTAERPDR